MPIIYITQDIERATGIENLLERYAINVPWESELSRALEAQGQRVFVLERDCKGFAEDALKGGTYGMMRLPCVKDFIKNFAGDLQPHILVLKNSELIEKECIQNGWKLLAPRASVAKLFEDKITQWQLLHDVVEFPTTVITDTAHAVEKAGEIGFPLVMQFNAGHSGGGTHIINSPQDFAQFEKKFPQRDVRIAKLIQGTTYTLNALVVKEGAAYTGSISKQLTGLTEATNNPSSTVGNDWGEAAEELSQEQALAIAGIAKKAGKKMYESGYVGLFGIDVIVEKNTGKAYCIEVNTHQPASISYEAKLHQMLGKMPLLYLWIRDMMENKADAFLGHRSLENKFEAFYAELPPLLLRGNVRQIIYRNKTDAVISSDMVRVPRGLPIGQAGAMRSRMKLVGPNEEIFRMQTFKPLA